MIYWNLWMWMLMNTEVILMNRVIIMHSIILHLADVSVHTLVTVSTSFIIYRLSLLSSTRSVICLFLCVLE